MALPIRAQVLNCERKRLARITDENAGFVLGAIRMIHVRALGCEPSITSLPDSIIGGEPGRVNRGGRFGTLGFARRKWVSA